MSDATPDQYDEVKLTCTFKSNTSLSIPAIPAIKIYQDGELEVEGIPTTATTYVHTVNATYSDSGSYTCSVDYGNNYPVKTSAASVLDVRGTMADQSLTIWKSASTTLSTKFYGTECSAIEWKAGTTGLTGSDGTASKSYASYVTTASFALTETTAAVYTAKCTYNGGGTKTSTFNVVLLTADVSVTPSTITIGGAMTVTCAIEDSVTSQLTWYKDSKQVTNGADYTIATNKLSIATVASGDVGSYTCAVTYSGYGSKSGSVSVSVNGVEAGATNTYVQLKETVTLSCSVLGSSLVSNNVVWAKDSTTLSNSAANAAVFEIVQGVTYNSMRTDMLKLYSVTAETSATYKCTYDSTSKTQDLYVIDIDTQPSDALSTTDTNAMLTCSTTDTSLTITDISWYDASGAAVSSGTATLTSSTGTISSTKAFKSVLAVKPDADEAEVEYHCVVKIPGESAVNVTSSSAKLYTAAIKSINVTGYSGTYIESNGEEGVYSENYTVTFYVYNATGVDCTAEFTPISDSTKATIELTAGSEVSDGTVPFSYVVDEANKESGTYKITAAWTGAEETSSKTVYVYEFCKASSLPSVTHGTWSPSVKVDFMSYATLTCADGYYTTGSFKVQCRFGGNFSIAATPTCASKSANSVCGDLPATDNGYVSYISSTSAQYVCESGYTLQGDDTVYTCNSLTKKWSIVTASNPDGDAPSCSADAAASSRSVAVTLSFTSSDVDCPSDVKSAVSTGLTSGNLVACLSSGSCELASSPAAACSVSGSDITVTFTLNQLTLLSDSTILSDAVTAISDNGVTIAFTAKSSKRRKRSTTSLSTTSTSSTSSVTCGANSQEVNGTCLTCSAGYGMVSTNGTYACEACALGYYSDSTGTSACTACLDGKSTLSTQSTASSDCTSDYCTVPTTPPNSGMVPPTDSRLAIGTSVTVYCEDGYSMKLGTSNTFACSGDTVFPPLCYRTCDLSGNTETSMTEKHLSYASLGKVTTAYHHQVLNISCLDGYELAPEKTFSLYECHGDGDAAEAKISFTECEKVPVNALLITVNVLAILLIIITVLFVICIIRTRRRHRPMVVDVLPSPTTPSSPSSGVLPVAMPQVIQNIVRSDDRRIEPRKKKSRSRSSSRSSGGSGVYDKITNFFK